MRKLLLAALIFGFSLVNANAQDWRFLEQKREEAAKQRAAVLEQIQHKQANPNAFLYSLETEPRKISFKVSKNGHYYIPGMVNGRSVDFIADTGASSIFLTQDDARKFGINIENLNYNKVYNTANGQVKAAVVTVSQFKVGPIEIADVPVSVSSVKSGQSLLGMSFFSRLNSYDVKNGTLTLYK